MGNVFDRVDESLNESGNQNVTELNQSNEEEPKQDESSYMMFSNEKTQEELMQTAIYKFQAFIETKYRLKFSKLQSKWGLNNSSEFFFIFNY
jgi:hypothetical protein